MRFNQRLTIIISICTILFIALIFFIRGVARFAHIFGSHPGTLVTQQEIWDKYHSTKTSEPQQIPKIIHQIFHNWKDPGSTELPEDWKKIRQTCIDKNPTWEHKMWSSEDSRDFLEKEYPWFLPTYDNYPQPVQRVDATKYFLMLHYGGIYIDMDNGCLEPLDSLLYYPTFITDGGEGTLSNNILGAAPGHPFYKQVTSSLPGWAYNYIGPYITVHFTSGQWFVGSMWDRYHDALPKDLPNGLHAQSDHFTNEPLTRISMDMRPNSPKWVFWTAGRGGTWDMWDARFFDMIGNRLVPYTQEHPAIVSLVVVGFVAVITAICIRWRRSKKNKGYSAVKPEDTNDFGREES